MNAHDEIAELLGAYALHALDADERAQVDDHLESCPRCRAELREHAEVAAMLGNSGGTAPAGVWDRIASALEEAPPPMRLDLPAGEGSVVPLAPRRRRPAVARSWVAAAAAALVVIGLLGVQVVRQDDRIGTLESALEHQGVAGEALLALSDPDARTVDLRSNDGALTIPAVVLPDGSGYLLAHGMAELAADRTYQLWGQTESGLVSLGLLGAEPQDVVAFQAGHDVEALAVTDEEAPGVSRSKNVPVVAGRFD